MISDRLTISVQFVYLFKNGERRYYKCKVSYWDLNEDEEPVQITKVFRFPTNETGNIMIIHFYNNEIDYS